MRAHARQQRLCQADGRGYLSLLEGCWRLNDQVRKYLAAVPLGLATHPASRRTHVPQKVPAAQDIEISFAAGMLD